MTLIIGLIEEDFPRCKSYLKLPLNATNYRLCHDLSRYSHFTVDKLVRMWNKAVNSWPSKDIFSIFHSRLTKQTTRCLMHSKFSIWATSWVTFNQPKQKKSITHQAPRSKATLTLLLLIADTEFFDTFTAFQFWPIFRKTKVFMWRFIFSADLCFWPFFQPNRRRPPPRSHPIQWLRRKRARTCQFLRRSKHLAFSLRGKLSKFFRF